MGQSRPLFVYFRCFHIPIQMTNIQFEQFKLKKRRWCAWDSNPGRHDGRRRRIHWAIAAPLVYQLLHVRSYQAQRLLGRVRSTSSKRGLLFSFFFLFSWQLTVDIQYKILQMTRFNPQTSGSGSDCSTKWATTTFLFHIRSSFASTNVLYWPSHERFIRFSVSFCFEI